MGHLGDLINGGFLVVKVNAGIEAMCLPLVAYLALTRSSSDSGAGAETLFTKKPTATVVCGWSGGLRPSEGRLLALPFPFELCPPPAQFCPPQQAPLPSTSRPSAHLSSPLPIFLPSLPVRFVSLVHTKILALTRRVKLGVGLK